MNKNIYAVTALFDKPDVVIKAVQETVSSGFKNFDVHSPYPLHGMNDAMKLRPSKLGFITLIFGLSGAVFAMLFMWWASVIDYPLVIGGKPFFSFPAYIPITFEVTVLSAAIFTVVGMLFVLFKFPHNAHPLHDTTFMKAISSDKFGIAVLATDPLFEETNVIDFLKKLGAIEVQTIHYDESELNTKIKILDLKFISFLAIVAVIVSLSTYFVLNKLLYMSPFDWMMNQAKVNPQTKSEFFKDGFAMRPTVQGTVSRGNLPYQFKGNPELAGKMLLNPLLPTKSVLENGKKKYLVFCSPCHGNFGKGDSRLQGQFPNPPTLHSEKVINWKDGQIYHVITEGQNIMPSYSSQITSEERWEIVHYIRALQRAVNANISNTK